MNRILTLILVAGLTFLIILFAVKPELIGSIWLWIIGLSGTIVKAFQLLINFFKEKFSGDKETPEKNIPELPGEANIKPTVSDTSEVFKGTSLMLLRFSDDETTTLGLLYVNDRFYCYTLEDTFHEIKIDGETRIPAGTYPVQFRKEETELTLKYRERYPDWFTWHLQLKNVPGFNSIYIHNGGDHTHTEGCLLVSDSLNVSNENTFLSNSKETFRRLYGYLREQLDNNIPMRISIYNENRIHKLK